MRFINSLTSISGLFDSIIDDSGNPWKAADLVVL